MNEKMDLPKYEWFIAVVIVTGGQSLLYFEKGRKWLISGIKSTALVRMIMQHVAQV